MAKKPNVNAKKPAEKSKTEKTTTKKPEPNSDLPNEVIKQLENIHKRYFKGEKKSIVKDEYLEVLKEIKEKYKDQKGKWTEQMYHKRAISALGNKKKRERTGGAVDIYYGVKLGESKVVDLSQKRKLAIIQEYEKDPEKAIREGLIMCTTDVNPETGEEERTPILDTKGKVTPRENREFFTRKNGSKFKNQGYGKPIPSALKKTVIGVFQNAENMKGIFLLDVNDKLTEVEIPENCFIKFTAKTVSKIGKKVNLCDYYDKGLIDEHIENLDIDTKAGIVDVEFAKTINKHYKKLLKNEETELTLFKLKNSKGTIFTKVTNEDEIEKIELPKIENDPDINLIYKEFMYPYTSDCAHLLDYHNDNKSIISKDKEGNEIEKPNYDEFVCLQDVNALQINMEVSMSGNYTLHAEDNSLFLNFTEHNENPIDSIMCLIPSTMKLDFGQSSKINLIGSLFQFPEQDEDGNDITTEDVDEDGETISIPVLGYPKMMVYGMYAIPPYKKEIDIFDMTEEDDEGIEVDEHVEEIIDEDEEDDMQEAIEEVKKEEKKKQPKQKTKKTKTPKEKPKKEAEETEEDLDEEIDEVIEDEIDESEYIDEEDILSEEEIAAENEIFDEEPW